jgi:hypothetical protein
MNYTLQPDLHPDADLLNAFAEQVLPEREQARVFGHIAACSRCRQILYLAQEAAEVMEAPARVAAARPEGEKKAWFAGWRVTWVPAAGFAALIAAAITLHFRPAPQPPEVAKAIVPEMGATTNPSIRPPASPETVRTSTPSVPANARGVADSTAQRESEAEPESPASPPTVVGASNLSSAQPQPVPPPPSGSGQGFTAQPVPQKSNPETAVDAWQQERQRAMEAISAHADAAAKATQAKMHSTVEHMASSGASAYNAAATKMQIQSAPTGGFATSPAPRISGPTAARLALPSGLTPVSLVTAQNQVLAIDQGGTLFVSDDSGKSWVAVERQWTGKPLQVRLRRSSSGAGVFAAQAHGDAGQASTSAPSSTVPSFEMVNDGGEVWISRDGRAWKPR